MTPRSTLAAGLLWLAASSACAAPVVGRYPAGAEEAGGQGRANVTYALERIPTATGQTALQRLAACGLRIQWNASWVARQAVDLPAYGTSAGDLTVQVVFDRTPRTADGQGLTARWFVHNGQARANSGWAKLIQTSPKPMKVAGLPPC